jgi:hypothetical protein
MADVAGMTGFSVLIVGILVVWRITHLFWGEDGPADFLVRLRRLAGHSFVGDVLDCFNCLSLWVSAPVAWVLGATWTGRGLLWMALSGGAILLERATSRPSASPPLAVWHEEPIPDAQNQAQNQEEERHRHGVLR